MVLRRNGDFSRRKKVSNAISRPLEEKPFDWLNCSTCHTGSGWLGRCTLKVSLPPSFSLSLLLRKSENLTMPLVALNSIRRFVHAKFLCKGYRLFSPLFRLCSSANLRDGLLALSIPPATSASFFVDARRLGVDSRSLQRCELRMRSSNISFWQRRIKLPEVDRQRFRKLQSRFCKSLCWNGWQ